jgi:hypothetical protein
MHTSSWPVGAMYPLAIAIALIVWFNAPAPIVWICTLFSVLMIPAIAPATAFGADFDDTLSNFIIYLISISFLIFLL